VGADVGSPVAPHALARQGLSRHAGWRNKVSDMGPRQPLLPHPPFLPSLPPDSSASREAAAGVAPAQIPSKSGLLEG